MNNTIIGDDAIDEQVLAGDVADAALENAAGGVRQTAGSITLAFCSGLDTCPA